MKRQRKNCAHSAECVLGAELKSLAARVRVERISLEGAWGREALESQREEGKLELTVVRTPEDFLKRE